MMSSDTYLTLGYDLGAWNDYGIKKPINIEISRHTNSHILLCGMSGSGKSYFEQIILAKIIKLEPDGEIFFADYKGDDSFSYLHDCDRYYSYKKTLQALDTVNTRLLARQSGEGVVLMQGSQLRFIKVATVQNIERTDLALLYQYIKDGLSNYEIMEKIRIIY